VIERALPRREVTDEEWSAEEARFDSVTSSLSNVVCDPGRPARPGGKAWIRGLLFDERGRLWVERRTDGRFFLDAFDQRGVLRGSVEIPDRWEDVPAFVRDHRIYLVVKDGLGVESVVVVEVKGSED
jgi:hypothetical protein